MFWPKHCFVYSSSSHFDFDSLTQKLRYMPSRPSQIHLSSFAFFPCILKLKAEKSLKTFKALKCWWTLLEGAIDRLEEWSRSFHGIRVDRRPWNRCTCWANCYGEEEGPSQKRDEISEVPENGSRKLNRFRQKWAINRETHFILIDVSQLKRQMQCDRLNFLKTFRSEPFLFNSIFRPFLRFFRLHFIGRRLAMNLTEE